MDEFIEFLSTYWILIVSSLLLILAIVFFIISFKRSKVSKVDITEEEKEEALPAPVTESVAEPAKEEAPEETKTEEVSENKTEGMRKGYRVYYDRTQKRWEVKKIGSSRVSKAFRLKTDALAWAEKASDEQNLALSVQKRDGKFQKNPRKKEKNV